MGKYSYEQKLEVVLGVVEKGLSASFAEERHYSKYVAQRELFR